MVDQKIYIEERMIDEINRLVISNFSRVAIGLISQYIETLGAFLDKKPFKTPRQSAERFNLALKELFPHKYVSLNNNGFLYKQLRSNFTHLGIESQFLDMQYVEENTKHHLTYKNKKTTIIAAVLIEDYINACKKVISKMENNELKTKTLA